MKRILMIGTGGTIASQISGDALSPQLAPSELLALVPAISKLCSVECVSLFNVDSTSMTPAHWVEITRCVRDNYDKYDGFVISHGTDTMAYTAAALSYMIRGADKPVILTGAQKPIGFDSTDSKINLLDAFTCACCDGMCGVNIVFNGRVILGTRARKTRSKSYAAFSSINYPYIATLQDGVLMQYIKPESLERPEFCTRLNTNVGLIKMIPGIDIELLEYMTQRKDAVIIEAFGVGGLPSYGDDRFLETVIRATERGKVIIMTTQVQNEGSDLAVYNVGHSLKGWRNVLEAYDMTTESALAKIMCILGKTNDPDEISRAFYTPCAHDILYHCGD